MKTFSFHIDLPTEPNSEAAVSESVVSGSADIRTVVATRGVGARVTAAPVKALELIRAPGAGTNAMAGSVGYARWDGKVKRQRSSGWDGGCLR